MSLYDSATEKMRKYADRFIEWIKDGTIIRRDDPTIKACRRLDKSIPDFPEEKVLENTPNPAVMDDIMKKVYE